MFGFFFGIYSTFMNLNPEETAIQNESISFPLTIFSLIIASLISIVFYLNLRAKALAYERMKEERKNELEEAKKIQEEELSKKKAFLIDKCKPIEKILLNFIKKYNYTIDRLFFFRNLSSPEERLYRLDKYFKNRDDKNLPYDANEPFLNLKELVESKINENISNTELVEILDHYRRQELEVELMNFIKKTNDSNQAISNYINFYGEKAEWPEYIQSLVIALNKKYSKQFIKEDINEIIENEKKKLKLRHFENKLKENQGISITELDKMNGKEFEEFLADLFEQQGFLVEKTPISGDYGADLILKKFGNKIAVQAKRYEKTVPNKAVQEIEAAKKYYDCDEAWIVTQSKLSRASTNMANKLGVKIIDREELQKMI